MGQLIEVTETRLGDVTIFATDRTLGGQDGAAFTSPPEKEPSTWPERLATRLWEADPDIEAVYVLSNAISVERSGGWSPEHVETISMIIRNLFVFYEENRD